MEVEISDGRVIKIDLYKISLEEYRALFSPRQDPAEEDVALARVFGLTLEEYRALSIPDWRLLTIQFFRAARQPLNLPNSASESTIISDSMENAPMN